MQFRVFYSDGRPPRHETVIEASDHRAAAQEFVLQQPVSTDRRINVERTGGDYSIQQFKASGFMDAATRASLPPVPPAQTSSAGTPVRTPRPKPTPSWNTWPVAIILLIVLAYTPLGDSGMLKTVRGLVNGLFSALGFSTGSSTGSSASGLHVVEFKYSYEYLPDYGTMSFAIVGIAKNDTSRTFGYAQIQFNLYDEAGNQVGSELANINNFEPGRVWKFNIPITQNGVDTVKLKDISGF